MFEPRTVSAPGLAMIARYEGFRARATPLPQGGYVIGHGHVVADPIGPIDPAHARVLLERDLAPVAAVVAEAALAPVSQSQFDALVSLAFSIGLEAFLASDVLKRLNAGEPIAAADAFDCWRRSAVGGEPPLPLDTLVRRRAAEKAMFLAPDDGWAAGAPSALLRPLHDPVIALATAPRGRAREPRLEEASSLSDVRARLIAILASEPRTAHALKPPPAPALAGDADDSDWLPPPLPPAPAPQWALGALAACGLALVAAGAIGLVTQAAPGVNWLLVAAPGLTALALAGYYSVRAARAQSV